MCGWRILYKVRWEFHNSARAAAACSARITPERACRRAAETWHMTTSGVSALQCLQRYITVSHMELTLRYAPPCSTAALVHGWRVIFWMTGHYIRHLLTSEHPLGHGSAVLAPDDRLARGVRPGQLTCNERNVISDGYHEEDHQTFNKFCNKLCKRPWNQNNNIDIDNHRTSRWTLSLNARVSGNASWNEWLIQDLQYWSSRSIFSKFATLRRIRVK